VEVGSDVDILLNDEGRDIYLVKGPSWDVETADGNGEHGKHTCADSLHLPDSRRAWERVVTGMIKPRELAYL